MEDDERNAATEYADNRYDKYSNSWNIAFAAFMAGISWRNERREISE